MPALQSSQALLSFQCFQELQNTNMKLQGLELSFWGSPNIQAPVKKEDNLCLFLNAPSANYCNVSSVLPIMFLRLKLNLIQDKKQSD